MKVCFVLKDARLASCRVRAQALVPALAELGVEVAVREWPKGARERGVLWHELEGFDAAALFKLTPSLGEVLRWAKAPCPLVYDFDDAVYLRQKPKRGSRASFARRARFGLACRFASAIVAGNKTLAEHARQAGRGTPVHVIPSGVPTKVVQRGAAPRGPFRMGWVGGKGNLGELTALAEPLCRLAAERPLELVVIADGAPSPAEVGGVQVVHIPWTLEGQEQAIATLDVGLMPLEDNPWTRGKCAYKLLQYMASGVAAVGSPVGMNADVIADGVTGRLAAKPDQWFEVLRELSGDPKQCARLGAAGRDLVHASYSFEVAALQWRDLLDTLARNSG